MQTPEENKRKGEVERQPHRVRLPGFIKDDEVGLGDAIKRVTYAMGIEPCGGREESGRTKSMGGVFAINRKPG